MYNQVVLQSQTFTSETLRLQRKQEQMRASEMKFFRKIRNITKRDRNRNGERKTRKYIN